MPTPLYDQQIILPYSPPDDPSLVLNGYIYAPTTTPAPCIVSAESGGFTDGGVGPSDSTNDALRRLGYFVIFGDVRLAKTTPAGGLPGQTTTGYYHQQSDDYMLLVHYMRSRAECNGFVAGFGGSGSGCLAVTALLSGVSGDTAPDCAVSLSGMLNGAARPIPQININKIFGYMRTQDLTTLYNESPIGLATNPMKPLYFCHGLNDPSMAYLIATTFRDQLNTLGVTNYVFHDNQANNAALHSWGTYPENAANITAFLNSARGMAIPTTGSRSVSGTVAGSVARG